LFTLFLYVIIIYVDDCDDRHKLSLDYNTDLSCLYFTLVNILLFAGHSGRQACQVTLTHPRSQSWDTRRRLMYPAKLLLVSNCYSRAEFWFWEARDFFTVLFTYLFICIVDNCKICSGRPLNFATSSDVHKVWFHYFIWWRKTHLQEALSYCGDVSLCLVSTNGASMPLTILR